MKCFKYFGPLIYRSALALLAIFVFSGCVSVSYKSESADGPPRPGNYPIPVYSEDQQIPRPCQIIGTVSIEAGKFTIFGGSSENEMLKILRAAHQKGADAIKVTEIKKPDFLNPNFRVTADLLRYADRWESVGPSDIEFEKYLASNRGKLDPIEGLWYSGDLNPHTLGIIRDKSKMGRDFIGFIVESENPIWKKGMKKMDIRRGPESGSYILTFYLDDFASQEAHILLKQRNSFAFLLEKADDDSKLITYTKIDRF